MSDDIKTQHENKQKKAKADYAEKIKALEEKIKQATAKKEKIESMLNAENRKKDLRRKILLGAFVIEKMAKDSDYKTSVIAAMDSYLTRNDDRDLFSLEKLPEPEKKKKEKPATTTTPMADSAARLPQEYT